MNIVNKLFLRRDRVAFHGHILKVNSTQYDSMITLKATLDQIDLTACGKLWFNYYPRGID